jgi:PAT family beta-lactamase induction signal transducer AmpG
LNAPAPGEASAGRGWREALLVYSRPRVLAMVWLGFSAGLPFLLVDATLSGWLRDVGIERSVIGFFSWVGIIYSIKVVWAPVVDRVPVPFLAARLGRRRSWMLLSQLCIAAGLAGMALVDPREHLEWIALLALLVAFSSATQDINIDAYRIEAAEPEFQGAMAAAYVFGYRVALLAAGAGAFYLADAADWSRAYLSMAALMGVGLVATLCIPESRSANPQDPPAADAASSARAASHRFTAFISAAVLRPFVEFFERSGRDALFILMLIAVYKLSDITMGVMANPFYLDLGFSKTQIAEVAKVFGFFMTIAGAALGGVFVLRFGLGRPLVIGAVLVAATNLLFAWLAMTEPAMAKLAAVISADNLSGGFASAVLIAYLSSLTNTAYTATQYALFSSLMTLPAKLLGGFAGVIVDGFGYPVFFLYAAVLGVPGILLAIRLLHHEHRPSG